MSPARSGFGFASASDYLYAFGGQGGAPSGGGVSAELTAGTLPEVHNWNSLGISLTEDRHLPGSAQESSVIFMLGGQTSTADATEASNPADAWSDSAVQLGVVASPAEEPWYTKARPSSVCPSS